MFTMKKTIIFLFAAVVIAGCNNQNDDLTPTECEHDWATDLDMTIPTVKTMYDKYDVGLFLQFTPESDVFYEGESKFNSFDYVLLQKGSTKADSALMFFNDSFMKYFSNDQFIKKYFPRRIFLFGDLIATSNIWDPDLIHESEDAVYDTYLINSAHSYPFAQGFAFSAKTEVIYNTNSSTDYYTKYRRDNMYIFLSTIFGTHKLYENMGTDFYLPWISQYYHVLAGGSTNSLFYKEFGYYQKYVDMYWFMKFGFPWAQGVYNISWDFSDWTVRIGYNSDGTDYTSDYYLPDNKYEDFRAYLNATIFLEQEHWDTYNDIIRGRMTALVNYLDTIGFDMRAFNPVVAANIPR